VSSLLLASAAATYYKTAEPIADSYLVKFKAGTPEEVIARHTQFAQANDVALARQWQIGEFRAYAATITDRNFVSKLEQMPEVEWVEEDGVMRINVEDDNACNTQTGSTWGIVRTSEVNNDESGDYKYSTHADGSGISVYVIDTGIYTAHSDFGGRAVWGTNTVDSSRNDGNGHGTHCAGTIGGRTYGLAKGATLVAVKVLSDSGSGSTQGVIQGVQWSVNDKQGPALASMSLGGGKSATLNSAITNAVSQGLVVVVAAGNDNGNSCNYSPASTPEAITVCASDSADRKATFSNWGTCAHIWAPGVSITSTWIGNPNSINTISGTSMACPHVAGQVAKYLQTNPTARAGVVKAWLQQYATQGQITNGGIGGTPNLLLFADCATFGDGLNNTIKLDKRY